MRRCPETFAGNLRRGNFFPLGLQSWSSTSFGPPYGKCLCENDTNTEESKAKRGLETHS